MESGRSGDIIVRVNSKIIKTGSKRLANQVIKQQQFKNTENIITPYTEIISENKIIIDLVRGHTLAEKLFTSSIQEIKNYAQRLLEIIDFNLKTSSLEVFRSKICLDKLSTIKEIEETKIFPELTKQILSIKCKIPVGVCHGDLTISNCMIDIDGKLVLLDFLDTFYETPIQDIASLFQETWAEWSLLVCKKSVHGLCRFRIWLKYLEKLLFERYSEQEWWPLVEIFTRIKLIRTLPYLTSDDEKKYIFQVLDSSFPIRLYDKPVFPIPATRNFIMSVAGKSSRFPDIKPKWLLTHPDGRLIVQASLEGIPIDTFDRRIIIVLQEHVDTYFGKNIENLKIILPTFDFFVLKKTTKDLVEAIQLCISEMLIDGFLFIKDCDNTFFLRNIPSTPEIVLLPLAEVPYMEGKGRVDCDLFGSVTNILEKQPFGHFVSIGGFGFENAKRLLEFPINSISERYTSDLIMWELLNGIDYKSLIGTKYQDWGTADVWFSFTKKFSTFFVDLDGTLVTNRGQFSFPTWEKVTPLEENICCINSLYDNGAHIIITTARPESFRDMTLTQLKEVGIRYNSLIMGLPHSRRFLINDFASSNPYPSAVAINLPRDGSLKQFL